MKISCGWLLGALLLSGCGKQESPPAPGGSVATAPVDYVSTVVKNGQKAVKAIDTVSLNEELQLFNAQEGRYPTNLAELTARHYLGQLPEAPAGSKIVYDAAQGKVSVVKE